MKPGISRTLTLAHRATKSHPLPPATPATYSANVTKPLPDHLPYCRAESLKVLNISVRAGGCGVCVPEGSSRHSPACPERGRGEAAAAGPCCADGPGMYPANKAGGSFTACLEGKATPNLPGAPQAHVSSCLEARDKEQGMGQEATTLPLLEAAFAVHRDVGTSRNGHPSFGHLSTCNKKTLKDCLIGCSAAPNT